MAETPLGGLDVTHGNLRLAEVQLGQMTWVAPHPGQGQAFSHALQAAHGVSFPAPGTSLVNGETRILWAGRAQALLIGPDPEAGLAALGAVIDQTEGFAAMRLTGEGTAATLARLCPLDLRAASFGEGRTARSLLVHMNAHVTAVEGGFEILVMRSMAGTAAHEIEEAMRSMAARAAIV